MSDDTADQPSTGGGAAGRARNDLAQAWNAWSARERRLVGLAAGFVAVALLWFVALQPALRTLRETPAQLASAQSQLQLLQQLAAEAQELRRMPRLPPEQAAQALRQATEALGDKARLTLQGERASVVLTGVSQAALRDWLLAARASSRARPIDATLTRTPQGWTGNVTLQLGAGS